jgi:hypothetical protein
MSFCLYFCSRFNQIPRIFLIEPTVLYAHNRALDPAFLPQRSMVLEELPLCSPGYRYCLLE